MEFPKKKYNIILADPPYPYNARSNSKTLFGTGASGKYKVMSWEDIYNLPVHEICEDNCALFLWTVPPFMPKCLKTIEAWGFRFITKAFNWVKVDKKNEYRLLPGYYTGSNSEDCYLGIKGKMEVVDKGVRQVISTTLRRHSQKPEEARDRIVQLFGDLPRIELFARERILGWDAWGDGLFKNLEGD